MTSFFFLANTFFQLNAMDKLFDGDLNTYEMIEGQNPFVRVQYNYSTEIDQLDITAVLGMLIKKE